MSVNTVPAGGTVNWLVEDNSVVTVNNGKITAICAGNTTVTASFEYNGYVYFAQCKVTVETPVTLLDISVKPPGKVIYEIGEVIDTTGMVLILNYSDGSIEFITEGFFISGFDSTSSGIKTVKVSYKSKNTTFDVLVIESNSPTMPPYNPLETPSAPTITPSTSPEITSAPTITPGNSTEVPNRPTIMPDIPTVKPSTPTVVPNISPVKPTEKPIDYIEDIVTSSPNSNTNIIKQTQQITAIDKTTIYGSKKISLQAKTNGDGKLTYESVNNRIASVSAMGEIEAKGYGKVTIIIRASATEQYNEAVKTITVTVIPKAVKLKKVASTGKKRLSATWKNDKTVTGYQIYFSATKNFKRETYRRNFKKNVRKMNVVGLKSKKTYYVKIRAYSKVGGIKYYSKWSKVKKIKIK